MKDWKQYICLHSFTGVVEPAFWRHTSVYILENNRTMSLLTQLFDVITRHVTFQTFFFDVIRRHHSFVCVSRTIQYLHRGSRTIQYLHRCLKTKDPLCWEQYNIYIEPKLAPYCRFTTTLQCLYRQQKVFLAFYFTEYGLVTTYKTWKHRSKLADNNMKASMMMNKAATANTTANW